MSGMTSNGTGSGPAPTAGGPRGLGAGWITFIVIDVLLVVALLVVGILVFMDRDAADQSVATGPTATASADDGSQEDPGTPGPSASGESEDTPKREEPTPAGDTPVSFASPSGNIICEITEDRATCSIAELAKKPKKDKSCEGTVGYVYEVSANGVDAPCIPKGNKPGKADSNLKVLDYGEDEKAFGFTCTSAEAGMGCSHDDSGKGFVLARAGVQTS